MQLYPQQQVGSSQPRGYGAMPNNIARSDPRGCAGGQHLASWPWRMAAALVDYGPVVICYSLIASVSSSVAFALCVAIVLANSVYMQGITGQSLGKRLLGIRLAAGVVVTGRGPVFLYPGVVRCFFRLLAHAFDLLPTVPFCIGFIRPLWQRWYRTWADSAARTVVLARDATAQLERRPATGTTNARLL